MFKKKRWKILGTIMFFGLIFQALSGFAEFLAGTDTVQVIEQAEFNLENSLDKMDYESYEITNTRIIYKEKFWKTLDVNSRLGNLSKTAVVKMESLLTRDGEESPVTYRAVFHQFEDDFWYSSDLEVMVEVGDQPSMLEDWARGRLEYWLDLDASEEQYELSSEIISDEKGENPIDGTARTVTVKLNLQTEETSEVAGGEYTIEFYKYSGEQNFWTNGALEKVSLY